MHGTAHDLSSMSTYSQPHRRQATHPGIEEPTGGCKVADERLRGGRGGDHRRSRVASAGAVACQQHDEGRDQGHGSRQQCGDSARYPRLHRCHDRFNRGRGYGLRCGVRDPRVHSRSADCRVQRLAVLAPEVVGGERPVVVGAGGRGIVLLPSAGAERNELLARTQPISRELNDVVLPLVGCPWALLLGSHYGDSPARWLVCFRPLLTLLYRSRSESIWLN
jgi:hypothetical protein